MQLIYWESVVHLQSDLIMMTLNYSILFNYVTTKIVSFGEIGRV